MGVVGAGASAGGAGVKYKKTKNRKEKGDEEMEQYKEAAEKNQIKILNLMTGLPKPEASPPRETERRKLQLENEKLLIGKTLE